MRKSVFRSFNETSVTVFASKNVQLYDAVGKLKDLLILYTTNDIGALNAKLTNASYIALSRILSIPSPTDKNGELVRLTALQLLMALKKMLVAYNELLGLQEMYIACENRCKILDDMTLLKEYLDKLVNSVRATSIFGDFGITTKTATVNPDYLAYILKYGYPEDGVFDTTKLGK
jgi:hypothetical protein